MSDELNNEEGNVAPAASGEEIAAMVAAQVEEQLAGIKGKLNDAYSARDEAIKRAVTFEEEKKVAQIAQLEEEGKHKEAGDLRIAEMTAQLEMARKQNTELTRDNVVRDALKGMDFRNDTAAGMAYSTVVSQLVQDENGSWVHRTGTTITDFAAAFQKDEGNEFLFKPKQSSGTGQQAPQAPTGGFDTNKSISEMSTEEILAASAAGHFDGKNKWL